MSLVRYGGKKHTKQSQARVKVLLSEAEVRMLKRQARDHNLSASEYLRWLIRKAVV